MTLPPSDAQSAKFLPPHPHSRSPQPQSLQPSPPSTMPTALPPYSIPTMPSPAVPHAPTAPASMPQVGLSEEMAHDRAIDFASHSWDLATGGLKTLTAKRELPSLLERRPPEKLANKADSVSDENVPRSYTFLLVILICLVLMLMSGGVVLFIMVQP